MKQKHEGNHKGEKVFRYSIRKYHFGAASVAVAALMFFANGTVQAQTPDISPATENGTTRISDLVSDSSGGVSEELSEKTSDTYPSQSEQSSQGNQKPQEASDENKSLVKDSEEGKGEKQAEEASRPTVDKSLAQSAQTSLQALLTNLTLDSMKELHARVEAGLAQAKAVLDNPNSSQEEVNAQVQAMKTLTEEVNKALAGGLTSPAQLGEVGSATPSEASPTPRRGRGRRGQLIPPATPAPVENQETKETAEEATDYTNGQGSYPLSDKIHKLLQELKTSTENPEQVQKLKEAYDKLNEALGQSENGLVNQEVFNAALEEYKKASHLKKDAEETGTTRGRRSKRDAVSLKLEKLAPGSGERPSRYPRDTVTDHEYQGSGLRFKAESTEKNIRDITISGIEGLNLRSEISGLGTRKAILKLTGRIPKKQFGIREYVVRATDDGGFTKEYRGQIQLPAPKATFITTAEDLKGKAGTIPQDTTFTDPSKYVRAKLPGPVDSRNRTNTQEVRVYLVKGGSTYDGYDTVVPYAKNFTILSSATPDVNGVVTFLPSEYKKYGVDKLGTDQLRLVTMIVTSGTDTPLDNEGSISPLSDSTIRATVDKSGLTAARSSLEQDLTQEANTSGKTEASKRAYAEAKTKAGEAIKKAKEIEAKQDATEADVQGAQEKLTEAKNGLTTAKNGLRNVDKSNNQTPESPSDPSQSGTNPVTPPSATRNRRTPPRRVRRSVGFVGNSQTATTPSAVDKSELQSLVEDLERRLQDLAGLSPEILEEAQRILREAQAALANDSLTAQELAELLAKVRQALNSIQAGTSVDKSPSASNSNKEAESAKEPTNATDVPLYGVFGAAMLSLLGALLFALARKKNSQLDKLLRELNQLIVALEASDKDKKCLGKAKKLAKKARTFVDSQQKDPQKEAELISEIKTILSQLKEEV